MATSKSPLKVLVTAMLGPGSISQVSRCRFGIRRVDVDDRIDILDWLRLMAQDPPEYPHAADLVAWVWLRRCDAVDETPTIAEDSRYNRDKATTSVRASLDVLSWVRILYQAKMIEPKGLCDDNHPYIFPSGLVAGDESDPATNVLRWRWQLKMPAKEAIALWLDGTLHIQQATWEERRATRTRLHNRWRRQQRMFPTPAVTT
jgi:hypothetical protein